MHPDKWRAIQNDKKDHDNDIRNRAVDVAEKIKRECGVELFFQDEPEIEERPDESAAYVAAWIRVDLK